MLSHSLTRFTIGKKYLYLQIIDDSSGGSKNRESSIRKLRNPEGQGHFATTTHFINICSGPWTTLDAYHFLNCISCGPPVGSWRQFRNYEWLLSESRWIAHRCQRIRQFIFVTEREKSDALFIDFVCIDILAFDMAVGLKHLIWKLLEALQKSFKIMIQWIKFDADVKQNYRHYDTLIKKTAASSNARRFLLPKMFLTRF